jgi:hypothetical protein
MEQVSLYEQLLGRYNTARVFQFADLHPRFHQLPNPFKKSSGKTAVAIVKLALNKIERQFRDLIGGNIRPFGWPAAWSDVRYSVEHINGSFILTRNVVVDGLDNIPLVLVQQIEIGAHGDSVIHQKIQFQFEDRMLDADESPYYYYLPFVVDDNSIGRLIDIEFLERQPDRLQESADASADSMISRTVKQPAIVHQLNVDYAAVQEKHANVHTQTQKPPSDEEIYKVGLETSLTKREIQKYWRYPSFRQNPKKFLAQVGAQKRQQLLIHQNWDKNVAEEKKFEDVANSIRDMQLARTTAHKTKRKASGYKTVIDLPLRVRVVPSRRRRVG